MSIQQLSARQLKDWLDDPAQPAPVLLDVREPWEFSTCHIAQSVSMPMQTVPAHLDELEENVPYVAICHHGARSQQVALFLERNGFTRVFNLQGGIDAWSLSIDPSMPKY